MYTYKIATHIEVFFYAENDNVKITNVLIYI